MQLNKRFSIYLNDIKQQAKTKIADFRVYDLASRSLNRLTPKHSFHLLENIAYGDQPRQQLDLYTSSRKNTQQSLIVFVHGGTWSHGDKQDYLFLAESFTQEGFDVAIVNYQLAPEHIFPSYVNDLVLALNYLDQHQHQLKISTDNLVLMGHSAGGFNIMSAVYSPHANHLTCKAKIKALVGLAGPYHFDYLGDVYLEQAFNPKVPYQQVMPYYFVEKNHIEHILLLAENDRLVANSNTLDMHQKLLEVGNRSCIYTVPKTGHVTLVGSVSRFFSSYFETRNILLSSLAQALNK
ncbi:alpha/beta hydrolase [Acinetobacter sp. MD2(2019)]|uniref:alpha/beta hydrolase n=1 Tax=Acinetobacter sp. MD2(2019) TaxID=2605273 RepID=UPI002D1EFC06|nr:alpha/beta hydrolase [Acinetobacter sp. MD2(2019)]MEB3753735.1 alpha/beta hydrolase [Acinetobacter sp. MD2(2019)]